MELFTTFFKIGLFTFGGGYAMLPIIEDLCVDKHKWITHDEMMDITVVAESTPGPVAINCATFVGYRRQGVKGSIAATLGVVLPSFIIIYIISMFLDNFLEIPVVNKAFGGIRIAVGLLIFNAALNMIKKMDRNMTAIIILIAACMAMLLIDYFAVRFSSVYLMLIAGVISLIIFQIRTISKRNRGGRK